MKVYKQQRSLSVSQGDQRRQKDLSGSFSYELEDAPFVASYRANSPQKTSTALPSVISTDNNNNNNYNMQTSFLSSDINKPFLSKELIYSPFKQNNSIKEESMITVESITEEDLDDWIAQSTNRPIQSFLDPYRQFKAPDQLIAQFKKRYPRSRLKISIGSSKKLYFSQDEGENKHGGRGTAQDVTNRLSSPSPKNLNVTFDASKLKPKQISGTSIRVRESGYSYKQDPFNNVNFVYGEDTSKILRKTSTNQQASRSPRKNKQSNFLSNNFKQLIDEEGSQGDPEKTIDYEKYDKTHQSILLNLSNRFSKNDEISPKKRSIVNSLRASKQGDQLQKEKSLSIKKGNQILSKSQTIGEPTHTLDTEDSASVSSKMKQSVILQSKKKPISEEPTRNPMVQANQNLLASQQPSKGMPSKVVVLKKSVKEFESEVLQKEFLKKIADKVEKLLAEKEDRQISENESSLIANSSGLGKEQDDSKPEQNFAHHLIEIIEIPKSKDQQESAVASFLKGVGRMKKNKDKSAITAFKQALNFDKTFFPAIYNLACLYERNQRFKTAEFWLDIASAFQKNKQAIAYGYAIIFYKQSRYEEAFKKVNGLIEQLESEGQGQIPLSNLYLRAICAKRLAQTISSDKGDNETEYNDTMQKDQSPSLTSLNKKRVMSPKNTKYLKGIKSIGTIQTDEDEFDKNRSKKEPNMQLSKQYYDKATNDYQTFSKCIVPNNFKLFKHLMFAIIFKKLRKMEIKFPPHILCEFTSLIQQILAADTYISVFQTFIHEQQQQHMSPLPAKSEKSHYSYLRILPQVNQPCFQPGESILLSNLSKKKEELIKRVQELSFFKRFGPTVIEKYLPCLSIRYLEKDEILFAKKGEVFIITGGHLRVLDHSKKFDEPDIAAFYSQGDIIGCNDKDNKLSFHPDIWFICLTKIEYLVINESDFSDLWSLQNSQQHRQILNFIRSIDLFEHVSQLTLYRLAFELLQEKQFTQSDIVYNDGESINKYDYITLVKEDPKAVKNLRNRISNKIDIIPLTQKVISGLYLIQEGSLELSTFGNWHNYTLKPFNFIGENLLIPSLSISRFGQIVCSSNSAKCLCLKREHFHKINSVDREVMRSNLQKSEYIVNCQKILFKYFKYYKIEDYNTLRSNQQ